MFYTLEGVRQLPDKAVVVVKGVVQPHDLKELIRLGWVKVDDNTYEYYYEDQGEDSDVGQVGDSPELS